jgi:predicted metal-dependent hydrolase
MAGRTVLQGGRAKAYRPLRKRDRQSALRQALAAYERGDFFLAHELLEPAWMGTRDEAERELHQGLIKLAAAYVHGVRGNAAGIAKNLAGARERLATADRLGGPDGGLDLPTLIAAIDARLGWLAQRPGQVAADPPSLPRRSP